MPLPFDLSPGRIAGLPAGTKVIVKSGEPIFADRRGVVELCVTLPEALHVMLWHPDYEYAELAVECSPNDDLRGDGITIAVSQNYARLRAAAYPPLADLADALVKDDAEALAEYKTACRAVKDQYPKPAQ